MKFDLKTWLIVVLGIVVVLLLMFPGKQEVDSTQWKQAIDDANHRNARLAIQNQSLLKRIQEDSVLSAEKSESFRTQINGLNRELSAKRTQLAKSRKEIQPQLDTIPRIKAFVEQQDSLIQLQDSTISFQQGRIYDLGKEMEGLRIDLNAVTVNFQAQIQESNNTQKILLEAIGKEQKELKKQIRQKRLFQITTVILPIAVLLL